MPDAELTGITLSIDGKSSVQVDLTDATGAIECTTRWGGNSTPLGAVRLPAADAWLSQHMGFPCSLCRLRCRRGLRTTRLAPVSNEPKDNCRYHDGAPLTVLSDASVHAVNRSLSHTLPPGRFRANIVVSGCRALEEGSWSRIAVGGTRVGGDSTRSPSSFHPPSSFLHPHPSPLPPRPSPLSPPFRWASVS